MNQQEDILQAISEAVDEVNLQQPEGRKLSKAPETLLYGEGALLDSLGLVTLVMEAEQRINERFACSITLANEKAFSQKNSPFRSIKSLAEYIALLLTERKA